MKYTLLFAAISVGIAAPVQASDPQRGMELYQNHCTKCHTSSAHVREKRKARNAEDLIEWVRRWQRIQSLDWTLREVEDVAAYLDQNFYQFKRAQR